MFQTVFFMKKKFYCDKRLIIVFLMNCQTTINHKLILYTSTRNEKYIEEELQTRIIIDKS